MNSFVLLLLLFTSVEVDVTRAKSHNECNDDCLTKTYCLSSGGSNDCAKDNLVTSKWFVKQHNQGDDVLGFTLVSQRVAEEEEKEMSLTFGRPQSHFQTTYSCYKSRNGSTFTTFDVKALAINLTLNAGSSYYSNNVLTCTWTFTAYEQIYPSYFVPSNLIMDSDFQISLRYGDEELVVATDTSELPIYRMQYLKCCYKVHGNSEYILVTNQTKDTQYMIQTMGANAVKLTVTLTDASDTQLVFNCNQRTQTIDGIIKESNEETFISYQMYDTFAFYPRCSWSHPLVLVSSSSKYDTFNRVFDLQIKEEGLVVYSEKGIKLGNGASKLFSSTPMIIVLVSLFMNLFM